MNRLCALATAAVIGLLVGTAHAEDSADDDPPPPPMVQKPTPVLAAQFRDWKLRFEAGEIHPAPEKGIFPWRGNIRQGIARLVSDKKPPPRIKLVPVAERTAYVSPDADRDPGDKVITDELIDILRRPDVAKVVDKDRRHKERLDYNKHLNSARVQEFEAALRTPLKKERIWSINWLFTNSSDTTPASLQVWGLFTRVNGRLMPLYLWKDTPGWGGSNYFYVLAVGDLNGDGIDDMVVRWKEFEAEDDEMAIITWKRGAPVQVYHFQ